MSLRDAWAMYILQVLCPKTAACGHTGFLPCFKTKFSSNSELRTKINPEQIAKIQPPTQFRPQFCFIRLTAACKLGPGKVPRPSLCQHGPTLRMEPAGHQRLVPQHRDGPMVQAAGSWTPISLKLWKFHITFRCAQYVCHEPMAMAA